MSRRVVTVIAEPTGKGWWALLSEEAGSVSQVRQLAQAADEMRDAIAHQLRIPEDSFDIEVQTRLPRAALDRFAEAEREREVAEAARIHSQQLTKEGVLALQAAGLSLRDIGSVIGLSHQRVAQLIAM